jgi:Ca2+-binding EF-hand superfamily protein
LPARLQTFPDLDAQFATLDTDGNGLVSYAEIAAAVQPYVASWPEIKQLPAALLSIADIDGTGQLSLREFRTLAGHRALVRHSTDNRNAPSARQRLDGLPWRVN